MMVGEGRCEYDNGIYPCGAFKGSDPHFCVVHRPTFKANQTQRVEKMVATRKRNIAHRDALRRSTLSDARTRWNQHLGEGRQPWLTGDHPPSSQWPHATPPPTARSADRNATQTVLDALIPLFAQFLEDVAFALRDSQAHRAVDDVTRRRS